MNTQQSKAYVLQLAKVITSDGVVNVKELRRIYEVMAAFKVLYNIRYEILDLIFFNPSKLESMDVEQELIDDNEIRIALAKDVLFVESQGENTSTKEVAKKILKRLKVTPKQLDFLRDWISWENAALRRLGAGEVDLADDGSLEELASRAAAVGVPLSALYFAGSVGFSAVGITSGLAVLGSASGLVLLGLNPMTAGIAALIIAAVSVKKLCDFAFSTGKQQQIEAALNHAKELQHRYRRYLLNDMTQFEKGSITDWLVGKRSKRKGAIEAFRLLLSESIQQPDKT